MPTDGSGPTTSSSRAEAVDRLAVGRIHTHESRDVVKGAVRRKDCGDPAIQGDRGEDGVAGIESLGAGEQLKGTDDVFRSDIVKIAQLGRCASLTGCAPAVTRPTSALMQHLLHEVRAGLAPEITVTCTIDDLPTRLGVRMVGAVRVDEDRRVVEKASQSLRYSSSTLYISSSICSF